MKKQLLATVILFVYAALMVKVLVFKDLPVIRLGSLIFKFGGTHTGPANLVPFKTILPYLLGRGGSVISGINLIGNILPFVPIGFLVPLIYRKMTWMKSLLVAVAAGFTIEVMQAVLRVGILDVDDLILNGLGVMIGYWFLSLFRVSQTR